MPVNEKYSYRDFLNKSFKHLKADEFNNMEIVGSCFYQENSIGGLKDIFPDGVMGMSFSRCNLDNVYVPLGNTIDEKTCCHNRIAVQHDRMDWKVSDLGSPVEPVNKKMFDKYGLSKDPKDLSVIQSVKSVLQTKIDAIIEAENN